MKKLLTGLILSIVFTFCLSASSFAYSIPDFPSCSNPKGVIIADYADGIHGVVGSVNLYTGSDQVYQIDENNITQCLCLVDGRGIQTNWWKFSSLDQEEINTLKNLGWYFVPDGSIWGLAKSEYMAQNINYSCKSETTTTTTTSSSGSSDSGVGGGEVLGLATTGTTAQIAAFGLVGFVILAIGLILLEKTRRNAK
ncbi:hypothetical protein ACFL1Q_01445 [Patescibacteria group bacterium]